MDQAKLRDQVSTLAQPNTIEDSIATVNIFLEFFASVMAKHHSMPVKYQEDADGKIICQMMFTKLLSVRALLEGVGFESRAGLKINPIIDPTILASLIRNLYETVGLFNSIFISTESREQRKIAYSLWVSSGLKYRQRFASIATTAENKEKLEADAKEIAELKLYIEQTETFKGLSPKNQTKLLTQLKDKEYLVNLSNNDVKVFYWRDLGESMGCRAEFFNEMYTYFSLYAHPSNVGVFSFREMFSPKIEEFKRISITLTNTGLMLTSIFIADYLKYYSEVRSEFEKLPILDQIILNFGNKMTRGDEYSINQAWKALGTV
jgi:hypothetical protein